ncbi:MAG: hypothetical protein QM296_00385 [Bacillota bacterium]|nr:hypothetical protein [Bacillota bacterium]
MKRKRSKGKASRRLLLPVLIIGSILLTIGFGGVFAAASEDVSESLSPGEVSQSIESTAAGADALNDLETTQSCDVTDPDETDSSGDRENTAAGDCDGSQESCVESASQSETVLSQEAVTETVAVSEAGEAEEDSELSDADGGGQETPDDERPAATVGYSPLQTTAPPDGGNSYVTLKFSVVEKGKPDSEQLTGAHVQLIHKDELFADSWEVFDHPVEKSLYAGEYYFGTAIVPAGYAFSPGITFRVNANLTVDIASDSSDPDPANWIWTPFAGDTIRIEHRPGAPFLFRNIDLMNPEVDLEGGSMTLELSDGVSRAWDSEANGKCFYLTPGTEGVYSAYTVPAGFAGSDPIHFKVDNNGDLYVQDAIGRWFLQADKTLVMVNMREIHGGNQRHQVTLGIRESKDAGIASLPGAVVKLQRLSPVSGRYYDIPGMQWTTGTENRVVSLFAGQYRLVVLTAPEGYEYCSGTGIFQIRLAEGDMPARFYILARPRDGGEPVWLPSETWEAIFEYQAIVQPATLKFSVVEKGKPDTQQLLDSSVGLIHHSEGFMDGWEVADSPVEKTLFPDTYTVGTVIIPAGFAHCPSIHFRVNEDMSVDIASDSSDPDPANWTWTALVGDTIRLEHERGKPVYFSNIDLENPDVQLEGARLLLDLSNGVTLTWESEASAALYYLTPGTEGEYSVFITPDGYVSSEPIHFKVDDEGRLHVQDVNGRWFLQLDNTLVMDNFEEHAGYMKANATLGLREYGNNGIPSLPGADVKLQRFNPVTGEYYDIPGLQWRTGTENRTVSLYVGIYRLVALNHPENYEYYFGTGIFKVFDGGDGLPHLFETWYQPLDGGEASWQRSTNEFYLEYRDLRLRIAVFRAGSKDSYTAGETIAMAARAVGGKTPYRYQFYVIRSNGSKVILRDYAFSNIFNWVPVTPDTYQAGVSVTDADGTEVSHETAITIDPSAQAPLRIAVFRTGNRTSYKTGETVALAARAEGGTPPYRYQFYVIRSNRTRVILRDYAFSNTFNWVPVTPDTYQVGVSVKDSEGRLVHQARNVTVEPSLYVAVFRTGNRSTYSPGEAVALAARGEGGTAPYRYQFYVYRSNGAKVVLRNFGFSNVFNWRPATPDTYRVCVAIEDAGGKVVTKAVYVTVKLAK